MINKLNKDDYKFSIMYLLDQQPFAERKKTIDELINLMEVSPRTFRRILNAKLFDEQEMSASNLLKVADYFNVEPRSIMTYFKNMDKIIFSEYGLVREQKR